MGINFHLVQDHGIKEQFQVERCLGHVGCARRDDGIALHGGLAVEHIIGGGAGSAVFEAVTLADVTYRGIEQEPLLVEDEDMVEQRLHIVHLMGGDDERAVVGHVVGHHAAELHLRGDVQSVGGLVHQQQAGAGGQGEAHEHFLLLAHRERLQRERGG